MERKHAFRRVVALGILVLALGRPVFAQYSGGTGTPNDPYQIATAQDLIDLGNTPDDYDRCFVLVADIDLTGIPFDRAVIAPYGLARARDSRSVPFAGAFLGDGRIIRNLCITGQGNLGLFGSLAEDAAVGNLGLENVSIQGTAYVGGLAGYNRGFVWNCYSTGAVAGTTYVGGLAGFSFGGGISTCYSHAVVSGNEHVAGLIGQNRDSVANCYSTGAVTADGDLGGLVAENQGSVLNCFWDTEASGVTTSEGGVGLTTVEMQRVSTYRESGWDFVGESANGTAETWQMPQANGYPRLSRFEGHQPILPPGQGTLDEPFLITNAQELGSIGYRPLAHYRLEAEVNLSGQTWGLAVVRWFGGRLDGDGYVIRHLNVQGAGFLGLFGSLGTDSAVVNLGLEDASVQGVQSPVGILAGRNAATVADCYSTGDVAGGEDAGGLVGYNCGRVSNCWSTGRVAADGYRAGGLVGHNRDGCVSNCYSTSEVLGSRRVGGLAGDNNDGGNLLNCYSTGPVTGDDRVGGLVGYNGYRSNLSHCYSTGAVTGTGDVGGLVGANGGTVRCSFWDTESSGTAFSSGGAGLTTAEAMDPEWIGLQGWANDPNWVLDPSQDHPRLAWEHTPGPIVPEPVIDWMAGAGTSEAPYELSNLGQLLTIHKASLLWEKDIILMDDLDLAEILWRRAVLPNFSGLLDGNGHTIANLGIAGRDYLGLVGRLAENGAILNLALSHVDVAGSGDHVGSLVGYNYGGTVWNCSSTGAVAGHKDVGGLIGENDGSVNNCSSTADVTGTHALGGLVGFNHRAVSNSYSNGTVVGERSYVGGLIGWNSAHSIVSNCFSTGAVTGNDRVGGLIGLQLSGPVLDCYSTGAVTGNQAVGGLVGYNQDDISRCYSVSTVTGNSDVGGLVGHSDASTRVSDCYSAGRVQGREKVGGLIGSMLYGNVLNSYTTSEVRADTQAGGLIGYAEGHSQVQFSFWDVDTSGQAVSAAGLALRTEEMQDITTYLAAGWDFAEETDNGLEDTWRIDDRQDYPHLSWEQKQ